jgi:HAD superfamily hydrolase (TIGR01490 family)
LSLAIFDLDNTLIAGDSDFLWGQFLVDNDIVDSEVYARTNQYFYEQYQAGTLDIHEYARFAFKPLAEHPLDTLQEWRDRFMEEYIRPIMLPDARNLIDEHRAKGDLLMIITATNRFITELIARDFGIAHLLATEPRVVDGHFVAEIDGIPCFQRGKVDRLMEWMARHDETLEGSWFYSDSHNDEPLLEMVDNPVAVDADKLLEETARKNGWKLMSLRGNPA